MDNCGLMVYQKAEKVITMVALICAGEREEREVLVFFLDFAGSEEKLVFIIQTAKAAPASARYYAKLGKPGYFG